ncbi:hypothetical protein N7465_004211, partial [Penicillium sp. CMV-2018d]
PDRSAGDYFFPGVLQIGGLLTTGFVAFLFRQIYRHSIEGSIPENVRKLINRAERLKGAQVLQPFHLLETNHRFQSPMHIFSNDQIPSDAKEYGGPYTLKQCKNTTIVCDQRPETDQDTAGQKNQHVFPPARIPGIPPDHPERRSPRHKSIIQLRASERAPKVTVSPTRLFFGIRTKTVHDEYMKNLFYLMDKGSLVQELGTTPPVDWFALLR